MPRVVEGGAHSPTVIVVGAGVSGCACAAELASAGLQVTLINSAMDRVGLPAYGPDMIGEGRGHQAEEALRGLPLSLRSVWLQAAMMPASGEAILNIDRRKISIETKRALEEIPGLGFRQGFVTDLRLVGRRVEVETIFGEVFEADAVVVAVGLSLGGRIDTGSDGRAGRPVWGAGLRGAAGRARSDGRGVPGNVFGSRAASIGAKRESLWLVGGPGQARNGGKRPDSRRLRRQARVQRSRPRRQIARRTAPTRYLSHAGRLLAGRVSPCSALAGGSQGRSHGDDVGHGRTGGSDEVAGALPRRRSDL